MAGYITLWSAEGMQNANNGLIMKWWRSNFNMPVPDVLLSSPTWNINRGPVAYSNPGTSFNLAGFVPGLEATIQAAIAHWEDPTGGSVTLHTSMTRPGGTTIVNSSASYTVPDLEPGDWWEAGYWFNVGVAGWEIDRNGTYVHNAYTTGYDALASTNANISITNCPSTSTQGTAGYIWVEGEFLTFVNANGWVHGIHGVSLGGSGTAGYMWVDTNNDICFVDSSGTPRKIPWKIKQFASTFNDGATAEVYAGTANAGKIWVDSEYGKTHLAYIGYDGYKYICGAGDYPYSF